MQIILLTNNFFLSVESFCWLRVTPSGASCFLWAFSSVFFGERCGCVSTLSKLKLEGIAIAQFNFYVGLEK